jgi:hypothetical protein
MPRERITRAALDLAIGALNRELGRDPGTTGSYEIVGAYGGWQLVTVGPAPACGAVDHAPVPAGHGFHSRRAIYDAVQCIRHGIAIGRDPAGAELRPGTLAAIADLIESMESEPEWTREWESLDRLNSRPTTGTLAAESVAGAELSAWAQPRRNTMEHHHESIDVVADLDDARRLAYRAADAVTVQLTRADAGLLSAALDAAATRAMHDSHTASDENDVVEFERLRDTRYALDRLASSITAALRQKESAL